MCVFSCEEDRRTLASSSNDILTKGEAYTVTRRHMQLEIRCKFARHRFRFKVVDRVKMLPHPRCFLAPQREPAKCCLMDNTRAPYRGNWVCSRVEVSFKESPEQNYEPGQVAQRAHQPGPSHGQIAPTLCIHIWHMPCNQIERKQSMPAAAHDRYAHFNAVERMPSTVPRLAENCRALDGDSLSHDT